MKPQSPTIKPLLVNRDEIDELFLQARLLMEVVVRILRRKAHLRLSRKPVIRSKRIVEYMDRMRITSLEKFDCQTYISTIYFYKDSKDFKKKYVIGTLILYVAETQIVNLCQHLRYPIDEFSDTEELEDACGTLCNLIAGSFKSGLRQLGYADLEMSHFSSYLNDVMEGVDFDPGQEIKYEISYEINNEKWLMTDLTFGRLPLIKG